LGDAPDATGVADGVASPWPNGGVNAQIAPVAGDACALGVEPVGRVAVALPTVGPVRVAVAARVVVAAVAAVVATGAGVVLVAVAAPVVFVAVAGTPVAVAGGGGVGVGVAASNWQALKVVMSSRSRIAARHQRP